MHGFWRLCSACGHACRSEILLSMQVILDLSLNNERLEVSHTSTPPGTLANSRPAHGQVCCPSMPRRCCLPSLSVPPLQRENARLKQHVLDLRRAARACGCDLNATEADAAAAYPELGQVLGLAAGEAASLAPAPDHGQLHRPERHRRVTLPQLTVAWQVKCPGYGSNYRGMHHMHLLETQQQASIRDM